jgi:hypothetical protein
VAWALLAALAAPAVGQRIESLEILTATDDLGRGPELDHALLGRMVDARPGRRYSATLAEADMAELMRTGLFQPGQSRHWIEPGDFGVRLIYLLEPNPVVTGYEFDPVSSLSTSDVEEAVARVYPKGRIFDSTARHQGARAIRQLLQEADVSADVGLPAIDRTGRLRVAISEHRLRELTTRWTGSALVSDATLIEVLGLEPFELIRPSALATGQERLRESGLFEAVDVAVSTPDSLGLVEVRVSLDARALPAPESRAALMLMDPGPLPGAIFGLGPLGVSVPYDLTPPVDPEGVAQLLATGDAHSALRAALAALEAGNTRAAAAVAERGLTLAEAEGPGSRWIAVRLSTILGRPQPTATGADGPTSPLARGRVAFAEAEAALRDLCSDLGCEPRDPASMRDMAEAAAGAEPPLALDSRAYASAMDRATSALLGIESVDDRIAVLPLIEELLVSREYLRRLDRKLESAPTPLPPFVEVAVGSHDVLEALVRQWHKEPQSPGAGYALGMHLLGRAFAATQDSGSAGVAIEIGGVSEAARRAGALLDRVAELDPGGYWPDLAAHRALATLLADPEAAPESGFVELLAAPGNERADGLLYAAVGPEGILGGEAPTVRAELAEALAERLEEHSPKGAGLAALAHLWVGDVPSARAILESAEELGDPTRADRLSALILLHSGDATGAAQVLRGTDGVDPLLGAALYAAGDVDGAARAYGLQ